MDLTLPICHTSTCSATSAYILNFNSTYICETCLILEHPGTEYTHLLSPSLTQSKLTTFLTILSVADKSSLSTLDGQSLQKFTQTINKYKDIQKELQTQFDKSIKEGKYQNLEELDKDIMKGRRELNQEEVYKLYLEKKEMVEVRSKLTSGESEAKVEENKYEILVEKYQELVEKHAKEREEIKIQADKKLQEAEEKFEKQLQEVQNLHQEEIKQKDLEIDKFKSLAASTSQGNSAKVPFLGSLSTKNSNFVNKSTNHLVLEKQAEASPFGSKSTGFSHFGSKPVRGGLFGKSK